MNVTEQMSKRWAHPEDACTTTTASTRCVSWSAVVHDIEEKLSGQQAIPVAVASAWSRHTEVRELRTQRRRRLHVGKLDAGDQAMDWCIMFEYTSGVGHGCRVNVVAG